MKTLVFKERTIDGIKQHVYIDRSGRYLNYVPFQQLFPNYYEIMKVFKHLTMKGKTKVVMYWNKYNNIIVRIYD